MGLAEPRKRIKISHDPNNLSWAHEAESYGQKLLSRQGWKPGQGLGARDAKHFNSTGPPKLAGSFKDDTLGLGASLKSKDVERSRTGLDAFQGLLGRLNGKNEAELEKDVQKTEDWNLTMFAQTRWGTITFVPGGRLVQGDKFRSVEERVQSTAEVTDSADLSTEDVEQAAKAQRRAEKKRRKDRERERERTITTNLEAASDAEDNNIQKENAEKPRTDSRRVEMLSSKKQKKQKRNTPIAAPKKEDATIFEESKFDCKIPGEVKVNMPLQLDRRHVIRGRNIQAKKMASADTKMLDQIFMTKS